MSADLRFWVGLAFGPGFGFRPGAGSSGAEDRHAIPHHPQASGTTSSQRVHLGRKGAIFAYQKSVGDVQSEQGAGGNSG
jgi:hypothetical protein